ncbi:MAG: zinc ribbon domain-containing protein [Candidatus Methanoplasma sp.]|jgi:hypothetical protein|nr:zinc ribbon domain-containing protein [Candidatus Methanoplasma sp.]
MDSYEQSAFCPQCGSAIRAGSGFCPACGSNISGDGAPQPQGGGAYGQPSRAYGFSGGLLVIIILSVIWILMAAIEGGSLAMLDELEFKLRLWDELIKAGISPLEAADMTDTLYSYLVVAAYASIASAALTVPAVVLCALRKMHKAAVLFLVLASIAGLVIIVGFVGLILAYMLNKKRGEFES